MSDRRTELTGILVLVVASLAACANTQGYPGPERKDDEIANILGVLDIVPGTFNSFGVSITSINGSDHYESWSARTYTVDLLPGEYTIGLMADWEGGRLLVMAIDALNDNHPREAQLSVRAGYTYLIDFDRENEFYLMRVVPHSDVSDAEFPSKNDPERCKIALTDIDRDICAEALQIEQEK